MGYRVTDLESLGASPADTDLVPVVDVSDTTQASTGSTKKMTVTEFAGGLGAVLDAEFEEEHSAAGVHDVTKVVNLSTAQTLTNKILTTPVIPSIYQDALKTKLLALPDTASDTLVSLAATQALTNKTLTTPVINGAVTGTITPPKTFYGANFFAQEGFLINGKISVTVASNNLTVAIKGNDGNDPSATNPVYCMIGGVVRSVTGALSFACNAGTNWSNAGGAELATKEIDWFAYLVWKASDSSVVLGIARFPSGTLYSEFSGTSTNEKAFHGSATPAVTDTAVNIGRFAATLSAGAGYTWSIPTFTASNLIQRPIYETRWLDWASTVAWTGGAAPTTLSNSLYRYRVRGKELEVLVGVIYSSAGTTITAVTFTSPFAIVTADFSFYAATLSNTFAPVATMMQLTNGQSSYALWCGSATVNRGGFNITHEI